MPKATTRDAEMGRNRTGIKTSPVDIEKMLAGMDSNLARPSPEGDESGISEMRGSYIADADPVGSVPPPTGMKGAAKSGAKMLQGKRPQMFLDKLGERLAFERTGTRLYDALITKCQSDGASGVDAKQLLHFRNEEAQHFALINECMEFLGADPTAQTPCADVAGVESAGLMQVITDPKTTMAQSLHALLVAELTDNAGWDELILLATKMGHDDMAQKFTEAQGHEREHLAAVRKWHEDLTLADAKLVKA
jgi:hypothetical protein